jgi:hypothetical protein
MAYNGIAKEERVSYVEGSGAATGAPIDSRRIVYQDSGDKDGVGNKMVQTIEKIDLGKAGIIGGLNTGFTVSDVKNLERFGMRAGINEALKKGLTQSIDSLGVRDILPDIDLRDSNNNGIGKREWRQPWSGGYTTNSGSVSMYLSNTNVNYEKKIYVVWGVRVVNTGPGRTGGITDISSLTIKDSAQNIYDIWDIEDLDTANALYSYNPLVFNNARALRIDVTPKASSSGNFDNIKLLGKIIEPIGENIGGTKLMFAP